MALTDRLQILIEAAGGPAISEFGKVATAAKTDFNTVSTEAQKAEANVAKLETRLSNAKPGTARYDTIANQLTAARTEADKFSQSGGTLSGALDRIGISGAGMGTAVAAGAATAGTAIAVGLVGAVKSGIDSFEELGTQTLQVQRLTGATAEDASRFNAVLHDLGVSADDAAKPLGLLANNVAQHSAKFAEAGVAIAKYKDGTVDLLGTLDNIRQKFQDTADATQKDAFAKATLGRGYQTLLPYLSATTDQLKEYQAAAAQHGEVIHQDDVDKARQFGIETRELGSSVKSVERDLSSGLVPALTSVARSLDTVITKTNQLSGGGIAKFLGGLVDQIPGIGALHIAGSLLGDSHKDAAAAATDQAGAEQGLNQALQDQLVVDQDVKAAQDGVISSAKSLRSARQELDSANRSEVSAEKALTTAQQEQRRAVENVAQAERDLAQARKGASFDESTDANLSLRESVLGVADARKALAEAQRSNPAGSLEVQHAQLGLDEAIQRQREAQEKLNETKQKGTDADKAVIDARQKVAAAQQAEKDSNDRVATAVQGVTDAKGRQVDANSNLAEAQDALNTAIANAVTLNADTIGQVDALIVKYPQLADALNQYKTALGNTGPPSPTGAATYGGGPTPGPQPPNVITAGGAATYGGGPTPGPVPASTSRGSTLRHYAEGGLIPGGRDQEVPIIAHGGEWVVSPSNPQSAIDALRALGYMKPFNAAPAGSEGASAWTPGGSTSQTWARVTNLNVTGNRFETPNAQALHDELERQQRLKALSGG